jgi:allantoin racemase
MNNAQAPIKILMSEPMGGDKPQPHWDWYQEILGKVGNSGTKVDNVCLKKGYGGLTPYTSAYNTVSMVQRAYEAEKKGYDAFIVGCATDLGLKESRAITDIPIAAPTEAALFLAASMGHKFSVVAINPKGCVAMQNLIKSYGFADRLASIRKVPGMTLALNFGMMLGGKQKELTEMITAEMVKAVNEDGAESIILPCVPTMAMLTCQGVTRIEGVPVLDLFTAALKYAEMQVQLKRALGTSVSKRSVYLPPNLGWEKEIPIPVD